jgi:adenylate cyclase
MSEVFISYAHSTGRQARGAADALRALGYSVWLDDDLPAHRAFSAEIEQQLAEAKAALVIWSAEAARSHWVLSEANRAREGDKLVQLTIDGARLPMPFDQIQCADLSGWSGEGEHPAWSKVAASIEDLVRGAGPSAVTRPAATAAVLPLPDKPSVAVMPFANLSGDPEQDYFADGMVEEITQALSRIKSIFVIGSGSTLSFKGKAVSPAEVGRQLGVRYLLEGSVRKGGNRVRIAARLTEAADGAQLWAGRFEDSLEDVFALQDNVALAVAGAIEPAVRDAEILRAARKPTESLTSYDLYLRALPIGWNPFREPLVEARGLLEQAVGQDPDFGLALALLGYVYANLVFFRYSGAAEVAHRRSGLELARRAVRAAPDDPVVLARAGATMTMLGSDWSDGAPLIERAVALNPGDALAHLQRGRLHLLKGDPDRAMADIGTAQRLDPLSNRIRVGTAVLGGNARFQQGRFAEAAVLFKEGLAQGGAPWVWLALAAALAQLGDVESARHALARHREEAGGEVSVPPLLAVRPEYRKMFEDGIAIAEGRLPPPDRAR